MHTCLCMLSSFILGMSRLMSSAENDRKFNSSWLKHWFKELTGTGGRCTWRRGCTQGWNLIINAYFLSISWFHFLPVSALISGSTWQANGCSRICSLSIKDNLFPEVTENLLCFLVLDWVTWPSPSHSQSFSSVQSLSHVWLFVSSWTAARQASLFITNSWSLLKLMPIEWVMPSNHLILCYPLLLLPSIFPSIRVFSYESVFHIRWAKYWSFSFNISPSNEYSGLISFRMDWKDLLAVQETLKSLLQNQNSKASILRH